ncbi:MAG: hypothetical protein DA408_09690 [Bacteroidetes bacterium]|nr:MAG: hypothetical protein C7N36_04765 [Bacteroidota bacterium]PTM12671.1 MAG: hypothetical protein DA408_09690 [Bacteroidota bacterium]
MATQPHLPLLTAPAALWDGTHQLAGQLELWDTVLVFRLSDFKFSNLNLTIPLAEIVEVEEYLVFDLARNGLRILTKNNRYDLFVLDDSRVFKLAILSSIAGL